jgi:hypothetical protein
MSLQIGFGNYNFGTSDSAVMLSGGRNDGGQISNVENEQNEKQMKKIGSSKCKTCENRKYIDGSDDPGVSYKAPTRISTGNSGAAVMSHEQEHVSRESAKAQLQGRKVIAQSVQIYTDVCPECGRVYTSGGKTTTVTKSDNSKSDYFMDNMRKSIGSHFGKYIDTRI